MAAALVAGSLAVAAPAHADDSNCVDQYWLLGLRGTTRIICDGPIREDGSWVRARGFFADERYVPVSCYWGTYSGSCTGGYWLPEVDIRETYVVTPTTVLSDEPGHIGPGAIA